MDGTGGTVGPFLSSLVKDTRPLLARKPSSARWLLCVGSVPIAQTLQRVDFIRAGANNYEISNEPVYFLFPFFRL